MLATFNMTAPDDHVEYSLWMSSSSDRALDFIEDFERFANRFDAGWTTFTPHYSFLKCDDCEKDYTDKNCFGGGKYCAHDTHHKTLNGTEIILEDLREMCVYKEMYKEEGDRFEKMKWWHYIKNVHNECYGEVSEACSQLAHKWGGIDYEVTKKCVEDSFSKSSDDSN